MHRSLKTASVLSLSLLTFSCDRPASPPAAPPEVRQSQGSDTIGSKAPAVAAVAPTGYQEVMPYLNANASFLSFYDTRDLLGNVRSLAEGFTAMLPKDDESAVLVTRLLPHVLDFTGIESVAAVGASSVPRNADLAYNRMYVRFNPGSSKNGAIWNLPGIQPRKFDLLNSLPDTTAGAFFSVLDLPWLDRAVDKLATESGKQAEFAQWKEECKQETGIAWSDLVQGLGDEVLIFVTLSPSETITIPFGERSSTSIPAPAIALVLKPKGDTVFQLLTKQIEAAGLKKEEADGVTYYSQPIPHPVMKGLSPTVAKVGGYLVIGSTKEIALATSGKSNRLVSTPEFKELSADVATEGNSFSFVSSSLTKTLVGVVDDALDQAAGPQAASMKSLMPFYSAAMIPRPTYSVLSRNGDDWLVTGNGPGGSPLQTSLQPAVVSMLAAIAVPNFLRARERSQATTVRNDAYLLGGAVDQFAIEQNKARGDSITFEDIKVYLKPGTRLVQSGGIDIFGNPYIIGKVGEGVKVNPATIQKFSTSVVHEAFWGEYR